MRSGTSRIDARIDQIHYAVIQAISLNRFKDIHSRFRLGEVYEKLTTWQKVYVNYTYFIVEKILTFYIA